MILRSMGVPLTEVTSGIGGEGINSSVNLRKPVHKKVGGEGGGVSSLESEPQLSAVIVSGHNSVNIST